MKIKNYSQLILILLEFKDKELPNLELSQEILIEIKKAQILT